MNNQTQGNQMQTSINTLKINGIDYIRADSVQAVPVGNRAVIVVDRGWIFAGDVTRENGRIKLSRAVWVFRWEAIGFDGVVANPKHKSAVIKPMPQVVDVPEGAEIFCVPVDADWGL